MYESENAKSAHKLINRISALVSAIKLIEPEDNTEPIPLNVALEAISALAEVTEPLTTQLSRDVQDLEEELDQWVVAKRGQEDHTSRIITKHENEMVVAARKFNDSNARVKQLEAQLVSASKVTGDQARHFIQYLHGQHKLFIELENAKMILAYFVLDMKIQAIQYLRGIFPQPGNENGTTLGLKEAKEAIEQYSIPQP